MHDVAKAHLHLHVYRIGDKTVQTGLIMMIYYEQCSPLPPQVSLEKSAEASMELDRQREVYREFARAGSTLFFLVETMKV